MYLLLLTLVVVLLVLALGGLCWYFSSRLLRRKSGSTSFRILVLQSDAKTIMLQRTANTRRSGVFGIEGTHGRAIVGSILSSDAKTITRQLIASTGTFAPQTKVAWNTTVYGGTLQDQLKLTINECFIPGPLGKMPAWFVAGQRDTWAILVHGATATREQGLRVFQTLAHLGLPILAITYRNDSGAPSSPDRLSHFGANEWQDLAASVNYAQEQGARRILLYGWSMGGTIVEQFLHHSPEVSHIDAVVLDSPILDWRATLHQLTRKNALPPFVADITERLISRRTGVKFEPLCHQPQHHLPYLLFHGTSDMTAPVEISDAFASKDAAIRYHRVPGADHTQCWNANPEKYEAELHTFLKDVLDLQQ